MMAKWEFFDHVTNVNVPLEINPSDVDMGGVQRTISETSASSPTGKRILFEGRRQPQKMVFTGVTFTKAQYEFFEDWANKNYQIRMTDDLGRQYWIYITRFAPTRRRAFNQPWLTDYTMEATVLDWSL